jgi:lipopolysaccharide export system protein LptA
MAPSRDAARAGIVGAVCLLSVCTVVAADQGGIFGLGREMGGKGPVTVTSKTLEYDYSANVVTYRGDVEATQGNVRLRSDELTVRLVGAPQGDADEKVSLQQVVATGNVRIDQGSRWATGGRAVFDQAQRTFILTEHPVLHDGPNEVAGDRVVVYLDENRSVVEGGQGRVKAVLFPDAAKAGPLGGAEP